MDFWLTRLGQVYSFVPIPGSQQQKRPRRRFEEIERMYKCGWNGCEKAYGTLNHLNAHVTMQSHGVKRTPEGRRCLFFRAIAKSLFGLGMFISYVTQTHGRPPGCSSARRRPSPLNLKVEEELTNNWNLPFWSHDPVCHQDH